MTKIYKYRPISELLFKELFYQELYFSSYSELNDPLDLSARLEFSCNDEEAIKYLIGFILKTQLHNNQFSNNESLSKLFKFNKDKNAKKRLANEVYKSVNGITNQKGKVWISDIIKIIALSIEKTNTDIYFDSEKFKFELERITNKFLKNSYITCFSESNNEFLMWSHYASKHSGICLEFSLENGLFPYEINKKRQLDLDKFKKRMSEWDTKSLIFWDSIRPVSYENEQPFINFFDFAVVFENEDDCDLIGLSKSWTHEYAHKLELIFSTKIENWKYEKEWRAIEINFSEQKQPEERIRHYPIECLSAVYFGINTPLNVRNRVFKILSLKNSKIDFFESNLNGTNNIDFSYWEYRE